MALDSLVSPTTIDFASYVCTSQGEAIANDMQEHMGGGDMTFGGGLSGAARVCMQARPAGIILAELGSIPIEMACECVTEIRRMGAEVVVIGEPSDIATYRALRAAGAADYFPFPVTLKEILSVERSAESDLSAVESILGASMPEEGVSIAVVGSNGGVGASLLTQNLAIYASAAKGGKKRTALIDADIRFGSQAIDLDLEGTLGLFDALKSPDRIDETFTAATMAKVNDRLSLYSNQVTVGQDPLPYIEGFPKLYPAMRSGFEVVITDLPRAAVLRYEEIETLFDVIIVVIPAGFSGVNAASRLIERITVQCPTMRILPVLSEVRKDAGLSSKDIVEALGRNFIATLPRCDAAMAGAHRAGRPLIEYQSRSAYARVVRKIWACANGDAGKAEDKPKPSFLKRMFS